MKKNVLVKGLAGLAIVGVSFTGLGAAAFAAPDGGKGNMTCSSSTSIGGETNTECSSSTSVERGAFKDVDSNNEFYKEISWAYENGITTGWSDGTFRPNENIKRDAMITFMYRMAGTPAYVAPKVSPFTDVSTSNVFYKEIMWAYENGITEGWTMSDGTKQFRPLQPVARDAVAAFLYRYDNSVMSNSGNLAENDMKMFRDVSSDNEFYDEIMWLRETGLTTGWDDNSFRPDSYIKRDAMAAFLYRYNVEGVQVG